MTARQKLRSAAETLPLLIDADVKAALINLYHDDILELEKIIDMDLSGWKK